MGIQGPQQGQSPCETFLGALADAIVIPWVVDLLEPASEFAVEFLQRTNSLAGQTQAGLKILLQGAEHSFDFPAAPRSAGLGVHQPDTQVGTDDLEVVIDEGTSVVSIQPSGQPPATKGFLEATQQRLGVGGQSVRGIGNKT